MERSKARAAAMQLIYEWQMGGDGGTETIHDLLELSEEEKNFDLTKALVQGVQENTANLDETISRYLRSNWRLDRISKVDLSILRIAVYEMLYMQTPKGVVINEAIELSRTYSTEEIGSFINGVLGALSRDLQAGK